MGKSTGTVRQPRTRGLADALFSKTQQRVLGLIFGQPDRSFYATELIKLIGSGSGAVQRELARLEQSQLVTVKRVGTQKHYQANAASPLFGELVGIARKTVGLAEPIRRALMPVASRLTAAFVYGSIARREDTARSDIDLFILSDELTYPDVYKAVASLESQLGRPVNPTIYNRRELVRRRKERNSFVERVLKGEKLWIFGADGDLGI
jgi:predicted nucleotidyltransferase